jgi:hypothetical protein
MILCHLQRGEASRVFIKRGSGLCAKIAVRARHGTIRCSVRRRIFEKMMRFAPSVSYEYEDQSAVFEFGDVYYLGNHIAI